MLVALLNPPWHQDGRVGIRAGSRWSYTVESLGRDATIPFPFFLAQTAAMLRFRQIEAVLLDGVADNAELDPYLDEVVQLAPDLVLYETSTPSFPYDCGIVSQLKARLPEVKIALAGPHVTVFAEQTLQDQTSVDYVLIGEYEATAVTLAQTLAERSPPDPIAGLAVRSGGQVRVNPRRALMVDLDALPLPARDPAAMYHYHESLCARRPNVQLMSSRGCVFRCPFCLWPKVMYGGQNLRARSPANVVDEIEQLERDFDFQEYYFDDDAINLKSGHVEGICDELTRRGLNIVWSCMAHTGRASPEQLGKMRQAGCESVKWGVETGDAKVLRRLRKGTTLGKVREVLSVCRGLGIRTHATFTIGLPGETADSIRRTRDFMRELEPDSAQISIATPFPGTDLYEQYGAEEVTHDWQKFDGATHAVAVRDGLSPEALERALADLQGQWRTIERRRKGWASRAWRSLRRRLSS